MTPVALYLIKSACYIAALYLVYDLFLSKDTQYGRNRAFILGSITVSLILPLVTLSTSKPIDIQNFSVWLNEIFITPSERTVQNLRQGMMFDSKHLLLLVYLSGATILSVRLLKTLLDLMLIIKKEKSSRDPVIRFRGLHASAFSAFGRIFVSSDLTDNDSGHIIMHEQNHLRYLHFYDIMFMEIIVIIQWFNPFVHLFNRSLRAVHEFQADKGCINAGISVVNYQKLIINHLFKSKVFEIPNSFSNPTLIKKRMIMMTKKRSTVLANLKLLMVLPVTALILIAFSSCNEKAKNDPAKAVIENKVLKGEEIPDDAPPPPPAEDNKVIKGQTIPADAPPPPPPPPPFTVVNGDTTWNVVDKMPEFPGGNAALMKYISDNVKYPESAKQNGVQGRVLVSFVVTETGKVTNVSYGSRSPNAELNEEALRVARTLPDFESPGIIKGRAVPVSFTLPITFKLQ